MGNSYLWKKQWFGIAVLPFYFYEDFKTLCQLFTWICFLLLLADGIFWGFLSFCGEQTWKLPTVVYYITQNPKGPRHCYL